jgi:C-terminal processing protease CtpA/Prc
MVARIFSMFLILCLSTPVLGMGEDPRPLLDFEQGPSEMGHPVGWSGGPPGTLFADSLVVHEGSWSARIERTANSERNFSSLTLVLPEEKGGESITLKGYLKTADVEEYCGLWLRLDGEVGNVGFDNMHNRQLKGTTDWTEYTITLPYSPETRRVVFGALLSGPGRVWVDDLQVLVDGQPFVEAPALEREITVLDLDITFDDGSGFQPGELSAMQIRNLALLGKVWGFLKYHHPTVTGGTRHWDYDLLRVLPRMRDAADEKEAAGLLLGLVSGLGEVTPCQVCAEQPDDVAAKPRLGWLADEKLLGRTLSRRLQDIYRNRHVEGPQFYVDQVQGVGNPRFLHEKTYERSGYPDAGFRLLALFRYWNIIEYWFPHRDLIDRDWDEVLRAYLPQVLAATDDRGYKLAMLQVIAEVKDGHAQLYQADAFRPPAGPSQLPVTVRFAEDQAVVTGVFAEAQWQEGGLRVGDVIRKIDGAPVADLLAEWAPYYPASNPEHRQAAMARNLTRGPWGPVAVEVDREGSVVTLTTERLGSDLVDRHAGRTHDLPGDTFRLLGPEAAYLKLSSVKMPLIADYLKRAADTRGLIIDIRNYPSAFVVFALGGRLVEEGTPFVSFTRGDLANPGAFVWRPTLSLSPLRPRYEGKVIILVDDTSISQSEYTAMALRAAPEAMVIGSTTAGADGNVSAIPLPGGLSTHISGIGVFYPDRSPTQRVGIEPDITVKPTVAGLRAGRDEVLEEALRQILGPDTEVDELRNLYQ